MSAGDADPVAIDAPETGVRHNAMKRDALPLPMAVTGSADAASARWRAALGMLGIALAWILAWYWDTAASIVGLWSTSETFAHGFVVAPLSLWLVWRMRARLRVLSPRPSWMVLPALAVAGLAWLVGDVGAVNVVAQAAFVTLIVLAVPAILGLQVARTMIFPLLFLFFAVPVGEFLMPALMEWTADFTVLAVRASGVPVYREGLQFVVPTGRWSVVEACSGIRYLIASLMAGTLFAYLTYRTTWRRIAFVAVAILLPIVANWVRAYMIVMLGYLSDNRIAAGIDHLIYGWVFFGVVMLLMFWVGAIWREDDAAAPAVTAPLPAATARASGSAPLRAAALLPALAAVLAVTAMWPLARFAVDGATTRAVSLGTIEVPGWTASPAPEHAWTPYFESPSAVRHEILRNDRAAVGVYIAYYRGQERNRKLVSSNNVLVRSSDRTWMKLDETRVGAAVDGAGRTIAAAHVRSASGRTLVAWKWYWIGGVLTANDAWAKAAITWSKLTGRGDDAAAIVVYVDEDAAPREALQAFVRDAWPAIAATLAHAREERR